MRDGFFKLGAVMAKSMGQIAEEKRKVIHEKFTAMVKAKYGDRVVCGDASPFGTSCGTFVVDGIACVTLTARQWGHTDMLVLGFSGFSGDVKLRESKKGGVNYDLLLTQFDSRVASLLAVVTQDVKRKARVAKLTSVIDASGLPGSGGLEGVSITECDTDFVNQDRVKISVFFDEAEPEAIVELLKFVAAMKQRKADGAARPAEVESAGEGDEEEDSFD